MVLDYSGSYNVNFPVVDNQFFRVVNAIWPDLINQRASIAPARNGMNRFTGKLLQGWEHVEQSMEVIFITPYHERVLRRWVGSFVPQILGEIAVERVITRFFWAISSAIDLWEPNYRIKRVYFQGNAIGLWSGPELASFMPNGDSMADEFRLGNMLFRTEGVYRPRAHIGDYTPYQRGGNDTVDQGGAFWDQPPVG